MGRIVQSRPKFLLRTNRKSHTRFRLAPISVTLDDLERPLDMIQGVLYWLWSRCVRVNKFAVFSVHKRSIIDYIHFTSVVLNVLNE